MSICLVAEGDGQVGAGHVAELRAVASALHARGAAAARIGVGSPAIDREVEWLPDYEALVRRLSAAHPTVVGWSVRTTRWRAAWPRVERLESKHLWIADTPDEHPTIDALVVPTLQPGRRGPENRTRVFSGPEYFPLDVRGPREIVPIMKRTGDVLLTLGGADRTEASLRIVPALSGTKSTVVIGSAFRHRDELARLASSSGLVVAVEPAGLRELLLRHRIAISAGGNTLFEAAAAGTPALVAWEDPHEEVQGNAFVEKGCARMLGRGAAVNVTDVSEAIRLLLASTSALESMSAAGQRIVDGRGADRIAEVILELESKAAA